MILYSYQKKLSLGPENWVDYDLLDNMLFSHRKTDYTTANFPDSLHFHDYYELVIYMGGAVRYVCENRTLIPEAGDIMLVAPAQMHAAVLVEACQYDRYVFYLHANAFDGFSGECLLEFLKRSSQCYVYLKSAIRPQMFELLQKIESAYQLNSSDGMALGLSYVMQLFYLLNHHAGDSTKEDSCFPKNVIEIKTYIDENFAYIQSISQIAEHFFYSREYVSRLFKRYLNTSINDYLHKRRITWCHKQLETTTTSINDICYQAGFRNMSSFIRTFSNLTGMPPSHYRQLTRGSEERKA